jgi:hypothetical protein
MRVSMYFTPPPPPRQSLFPSKHLTKWRNWPQSIPAQASRLFLFMEYDLIACSRSREQGIGLKAVLGDRSRQAVLRDVSLGSWSKAAPACVAGSSL